jgi:hypothetical protein
LSELAQRLDQEGPILLGSNSCGGTAFVDAESGESLLAFERTETGVGIRSIVRGEDGSVLLIIVPGHPLSFPNPGAEVRMEVGPAPLVVGDKHCRSFAITSCEQPVLCGRLLRNGRLLIYNVSLRNRSGRLVFRVARDALECSGGTGLLGTLTTRSSRPPAAGFARWRFPRRCAPRRRLSASVGRHAQR